MLVVEGKRFNGDWLRSVSISKAKSVCTDTPKDVVEKAWKIANGITEETPTETEDKPKPKRSSKK